MSTKNKQRRKHMKTLRRLPMGFGRGFVRGWREWLILENTRKAILPFIVMILMAVHFWRVRKDGGISGPT